MADPKHALGLCRRGTYGEDMKPLDAADRRQNAPVAVAPLRATAATGRRRGTGFALMLASSVSNQAGAALGSMAFPVIGPVGVLAVRQLVTALVLAPVVRPRLRALRKDRWLPILGLALVFSMMNLSLYAAIDRIGLGLAVTLEFLGPLGVAIAFSRRPFDVACALLAGVGVIVLINPGPATDILGIALGLVAAAGWGSYILLNRTLGQRLPGLQGTAAASIVTAGMWVPIAILWFLAHVPSIGALGLAAACGLLSSVVPAVSDLQALRRVPARIFGIFTSLSPVWAVLAGWVMLHQALQPNEWLGVALIVLSNIFVSVRGLATSRPRTRTV